MDDPTYKPDTTEALEILSASPFFGRLDRAGRAEIAGELEFVTVGGGEYLFRQGDPGDSLYVIDSGLLEVRLMDIDGKEQTLDRLDAGATVGEMALLSGRPRSAGVVAVVDTRLVRLPKAAFDRLAEHRPEILSGFAFGIAPRVQRTQLAGVLSTLFGHLDASMLHEIQERLTWRRLSDGETLVRQGEIGDSMYIVVNGRLQVVLEPDPDDPTRRETQIVGEAAAGETVGEFALLSDEPRAATVIAVRDTDVVEMTRVTFRKLMSEYPQLMTAISRIIVRRSQRSMGGPEVCPMALTMAIVPAGPDGAPLEAFAHQLAEQLKPFGATAVFTRDRLDASYGRSGTALTEPDEPLSLVLNSWLQEQEMHHRHVIYVADAEWNRWTERCVAQADRIVMVAQADGDPAPGRFEAALNQRTRRELVLLHPTGTVVPHNTAAWLDGRALDHHHHVREDDPAHWARLARRLTDRTIGMAFSGGAARGMAHIGVIGALEELGQPVDYIGATSMGALISAGWAQGRTYADGIALARQFSNPANILDRTFPATAVMVSRKVTNILIELFGDTTIEDLWRPFFCISTNLSAAVPVIHQRGPLWRAIRASIALPAVFTPILNENNELLVDGGVMNNFPVDVLGTRCAFGLMIGSNVSPHTEQPFPQQFGDSISGWDVLISRFNPFRETKPYPALASIVMRTLEVNSVYHRKRAEQYADIIIQPDVTEFSFMAFDRYQELIDRGYQAAMTAMTQYRDA